jgi:hypothetical protein
VTLRVLGAFHVLVGLLMLPFSIVFGIATAPILALGALWMVVLGFRLWSPGERILVLARRTHVVSAAIAGLLALYGAFALRAAERSAAKGGGLLGGFGFLPLAAGALLGCLALTSLWVAGRGIAAVRRKDLTTRLRP